MDQLSDTLAEAERVRLAAIRARSPEQRLRDALSLSDVVHAATMARLETRYPNRSRLELVRMLSADSVARDIPR